MISDSYRHQTPRRQTKARRTKELLDKYLSAVEAPDHLALYYDQLEALERAGKLFEGKYRGIAIVVVSKPAHIIQKEKGPVAAALEDRH